jgi:hypothetical protein
LIFYGAMALAQVTREGNELSARIINARQCSGTRSRIVKLPAVAKSSAARPRERYNRSLS